MGKKPVDSGTQRSLRQRAESRIDTALAPLQLTPGGPERLRLMAELEVHQVELQLQNEELCRARDQLEAASIKYRELYDNAPVGYLTLDATGQILETNSRAAELLGGEPALLLGCPLGCFVATPYAASYAGFLFQLGTGGVPQCCEIALKSRTPDVRTVQLNGVISDRSAEGRQLLVTVVDITRRRIAEEALRRAHDEMERRVNERTRDLATAHARLQQSEARLSRAQTVARIGVWECDFASEGRIFWSNEVYDLLELERGGPVPSLVELRELIHPEDQHLASPVALTDDLRRQQLQRTIRVISRRTHTLRYLQVCAEIVAGVEATPRVVIGTVQDITPLIEAQQERLRIEQQLWQAQKMESLGLLAGGVAHDFNNLLQGVLGNADLALSAAGQDSETIPYLETIRATSVRLSGLTQQLLTYAGKRQKKSKPLDLNRVLLDMSQLLAVSLPKHVHVSYELAEKLPAVAGDVGQLGQVFMNLVINASESLVGLADAAATIEVRSSALLWSGSTETELVFGSELHIGRRYVAFEVVDSGCGMSRETRNKLFEPFFSTKFVGRGLGLSVVLGIVKNHGGAVVLWSEPGQGSRFRVLLPSTNESLKEEPASRSQIRQLWHGDGLVLFADDEPVTRKTTRVMLERMGFEVALACDGVAAIEVMQQRGDTVRLALLDVTMPRMGGLEAMRIIQERWPATIIVLASGYTEDQAMNAIEPSERPPILQKPYGFGELGDMIQSAMAGHCQAATGA